MGKIKAFFSKTNNLILYSIALILILFAIHFSLKIFNLKLRLWVYFTVFIISMLLIFISLILKFIKKSIEIKLILTLIATIIILLFNRVILFGFLLLVLLVNPEHIVERNGYKYVACVQSFLTDTTVCFHKYVNFLVMGSEVEFREYYNGSYDPIEKEREKEEENIIYNVESSNSEQTQITTENPVEILYENEIRNDTIIRIVNEGYVLGGKMIINVQKTTDNANTWRNQINNSDGCITVNREAKFIFINENVGFINNQSLFILGEENNSLLVTVDGGQSFKNANFIFPLDVENTAFRINDLPHLEGKKLKIKLYPSENSERTYYEFASVDNGLNWIYYE